MRRLPDWPERLAAALRAADGRRFAWGSHDCVLFAADLVRAMTGHDLARGLRGTYWSRAGAARVLRARGGNLAAAVAGTLAEVGWPEVAPDLAGRGDLVLLPTGQGPAAGIRVGRWVAAAGACGPTYRLAGEATRAWRVG